MFEYSFWICTFSSIKIKFLSSAISCYFNKDIFHEKKNGAQKWIPVHIMCCNIENVALVNLAWLFVGSRHVCVWEDSRVGNAAPCPISVLAHIVSIQSDEGFAHCENTPGLIMTLLIQQ